MFKFILFLSSLIFLLIYFQSAFDKLSIWIKGNGLIIAVMVFFGTIALSIYQKKPIYDQKSMVGMLKTQKSNQKL